MGGPSLDLRQKSVPYPMDSNLQGRGRNRGKKMVEKQGVLERSAEPTPVKGRLENLISPIAAAGVRRGNEAPSIGQGC